MAGNAESCGSQLAEMKFPSRVNSQGSNDESSSHIRASKYTAADERRNLRLNSRGVNSFHRSGARSTVSNRKYSSVAAKVESSSSSSSSPPNSTFSSNGRQVSVSLDKQNAVHCFSSSSDESGSDLDLEVAERLVSKVPAGKDTGRRNGFGASGASAFTAFTGEMMEGDARALSRQSRSRSAGGLSWGENLCSSIPDSRRANGSSSGALTSEQDGLLGISITESSLLSGSSSDCHCIDGFKGALNMDRTGRLLSTEGVSNLNGEMNATRNGQSLHGSSSTANLSRQFGQLIGSGSSSAWKKKSGKEGILSCRSRAEAPQGVLFRESSGNTVGSSHGVGLSRRNLSNLSCSSAADVLPSVSSSSMGEASDRVHHKKAVGASGLNSRADILRDIRSGKNQVATGSNSGCTRQMITTNSLGSSPSEQTFQRVDSQPSRFLRRSPPGFQPDTRRSRRPVSLDSMTPRASVAYASGQSSMASCATRGGSPAASRGRSSHQPLSASNELFLDSAAAFGEELSNRFASSSSRIPSRSSMHANQFVGSFGLENGNMYTGRADFLPSSSTMTFLPEAQPIRSSLSGPPPTRPPPLPPFGSSLPQSSASQIALSAPAFNSDSFPPQGLHFNGHASSDDNETENTSDRESAAYVPFQGFQLHSIGESQPRLTVEGLSEILLALEHVERDEDLSYEQILMLEATILLGGIGFQDRHRDLRLDVDNMSYEELLALEERMGNVSTGLSEETIGTCLKRTRYALLKTTNSYVPQDIEARCSICQEDFEEAVELGVLECGHSYHFACIKQWLAQKNQCPICKASVTT